MTCLGWRKGSSPWWALSCWSWPLGCDLGSVFGFCCVLIMSQKSKTHNIFIPSFCMAGGWSQLMLSLEYIMSWSAHRLSKFTHWEWLIPKLGRDLVIREGMSEWLLPVCRTANCLAIPWAAHVTSLWWSSWRPSTSHVKWRYKNVVGFALLAHDQHRIQQTNPQPATAKRPTPAGQSSSGRAPPPSPQTHHMEYTYKTVLSSTLSITQTRTALTRTISMQSH